jgi:hypothetical protein
MASIHTFRSRWTRQTDTMPEHFDASERVLIAALGESLGIDPRRVALQPRETVIALKRTFVKWGSCGLQASIDMRDDLRIDAYLAARGRLRSDWPGTSDLVCAFAELDARFAECPSALDLVRASAWAWQHHLAHGEDADEEDTAR